MSQLLLNACIAETKLPTGFPVKLYSVENLNAKNTPEILERIADYYFTKHRHPCSGLVSSHGNYLAIANQEMMPRSLTLGYEIKYKLKVFDNHYILDPQNRNERRTISKIISRALRKHLFLGSVDDIWQRNKSQRIFCNRNHESIQDQYEIFRCFQYRIDIFPDGRVSLTLDPTTTILNRNNLYEQFKSLPSREFSHLFTNPVTGFKGRFMILDSFGRNRRNVFVEGFLKDKTIHDVVNVSRDGKEITPYDQYHGVNPFSKIPLHDDEPPGIIRFHQGAKVSHLVPLSCLHFVFSNYELRDEPVSRHLIMPTKKRIGLTSGFSKIISRLTVGQGDSPEYNIKFSRRFSNASDFTCEHIPLPILQFSRGSLTERDVVQISRWNQVKKNGLKRYGSYKKASIAKILIIHPRMEKREIEDFYSDMRSYAMEWDEVLPSEFTTMETNDYTDILPRLEEYQKDYNAAVIIFPDYNTERYYRMKSALNIPSQGVTLRTIRSKAYFMRKGKEYLYNDEIMNIVSGLISKCGAIPWILSKPLSCDCYIGIDSGGSTSRIWGYAYVFDRHGKFAGAGKGQAFDKEGLEKSRFKNSIIHAIMRYEDYTPNRIIIHRDGRIVGTEREGLIEAINELVKDGKLDSEVEYATVNVKKNTPFRIFERGDQGLDDSFIGGAFYLDEHRSIVVTTGKPIVRQGTSNPLLIEVDVIKGNFDIKDVTRDVFYLSELNWGSPTKDMKLPLTIRFAESMIDYADKNVEFAGVFPV